jgi:alpha-tubulin suppressor-like RCC1 family protein
MRTLNFSMRIFAVSGTSLRLATVAAGAFLCCVRAEPLYAQPTNGVVAWGAGTNVSAPPDSHNYGQSIIPVTLSNVVQVAGGGWHSLALKTNSVVQGWGDDSVHETDFLPTNGYVAIACGFHHSLALRTNGTVAAAGDVSFGATSIPPGLSNVVAVGCGFYHSVALKSDGTMAAWGGTGAENDGQGVVPPGLSNVVAMAAGGFHNLALKSDGTVLAWGANDSGQTNVPSGLSTVVAVAAGAEHSAALKSDGTVVDWGANEYNQLAEPASLTNVVAIAAGGWHTLALRADGTVVAWGAGSGSNTNVDFGQNIVPPGLSNVVQIAGGAWNSLAVTSTCPLVLQATLTNVTRTSNRFSVSVPTRSGRVYRLEYKNSLADSTWTALPLQAGNGGALVLSDPSATSDARFYRVRQW